MLIKHFEFNFYLNRVIKDDFNFVLEPEVEAKPEEAKKDESEEKQNKKEEGINHFHYFSFKFQSYLFVITLKPLKPFD